eukprot:SAG31_NODE_5722_length_2359_cov_81.762832_1_plen_82_part_00
MLLTHGIDAEICSRAILEERHDRSKVGEMVRRFGNQPAVVSIPRNILHVRMQMGHLGQDCPRVIPLESGSGTASEGFRTCA